MRPLAGEIGDDRRLPIRLLHGDDPGRFTHAGADAVGTDDEPRAERVAVVEKDFTTFRRPADRRDRARRMRGDAGGMDERDECRAQRALLDDPGERALADLVRAEVEHSVIIAFDAHRLDGRDALGCERLPRAQRAQQGRAARTDRVDAGIPVLSGRRHLRGSDGNAIDERHGESGGRERRREREPDEAGAGDQHVAIGSSYAVHSLSSVSMTWFWFV